MIPGKSGSVRTALVVFLATVGACALEPFGPEPPDIGDDQMHSSTIYDLNNDLVVDCAAQNWTRKSGTTFAINLAANQTIFIGSDTLIEYPAENWGSDESIENAFAYLACRDGSVLGVPGWHDQPSNAEIQGRTNQNLHNVGSGNVSDTHFARAMYTAAGGYTGVHTHYCWVSYACGPVPDPPQGSDPDGQVTVRAGSTIFHHTVDEFPGTNWQLATDDWITSTTTDRIHTGTWNAGLTTSGFDELVVRWSPQVDHCLSGDSFCQGYYSSTDDTFFRWRLGVDQYRVNTDGSSTLCNSTVGAWSNAVVCTRYNHHCDINIYTTNFPISKTTACGGSSGPRRFTVYADMKKDLDGAPYADMRIHGGQATNLMVYAHHLP